MTNYNKSSEDMEVDQVDQEAQEAQEAQEDLIQPYPNSPSNLPQM